MYYLTGALQSRDSGALGAKVSLTVRKQSLRVREVKNQLLAPLPEHERAKTDSSLRIPASELLPTVHATILI